MDEIEARHVTDALNRCLEMDTLWFGRALYLKDILMNCR